MNRSGRIARREFLQTVAAGALATGVGAPEARAETSTDKQPNAKRRKRRPNVLVIMSDEHDPAITGCYRNRTVRTPNLDRLAGRGVTFDCAYTNSPLCVPSRLAFTAGKYISRIGAWSNNCWLPSADYPSLPRIMNAAGYESFLCGKQHYDRTRRYGFTEIGGDMNRHFKTGRGGRRRADATNVNVRSRDQRFKDFRPGEDSSILKHDRQVTTGVVDFLSKRKRTDKPFFMFAGYLAPHFPLIVPESYWDPYKGKVPMPVLPPGHVASQPLNYHHLRRGFGVVETDPKVVRAGRELYYGLTQWLDDQIGKVLGALGKSGLADETIVVYTTDHGENLGEHALWWKNCMYEHAARVPMIVSWPERWAGGQRRTGACSMVDLVQTIAEIGGADVPGDWNGDSLCGCLDDGRAKWKDIAVSEYYAHNIASGFAMLRSGDHKYVHHTRMDDTHGPERELYDLAKDPDEFANLASRQDQASRIDRMHAALVKELGRDPDETEQICRHDYKKGYGRPNEPKKRKGKRGERQNRKATRKRG